jgi:hypothetical protein
MLPASGQWIVEQFANIGDASNCFGHRSVVGGRLYNRQPFANWRHRPKMVPSNRDSNHHQHYSACSQVNSNGFQIGQKGASAKSEEQKFVANRTSYSNVVRNPAKASELHCACGNWNRDIDPEQKRLQCKQPYFEIACRRHADKERIVPQGRNGTKYYE